MNTAKPSLKAFSTNPPRVAVIGCGAIARTFHLPALASEPAIRERLVLVDPAVDRANALAHEFGISAVAAHHAEVLPDVDAVIITTPHHLHFEVALAAARAGRHVLCEKPLAESAEHVRQLIAAAKQTGAVIAVNNTRRLIPSCRKAGQLIRDGALGELSSIDCCEGDRFDWPSASASVFGARGGGKGVLLDIGAHVIDLTCWWLNARPALVSYQDDSFGGSEAVADVMLRHGKCDVHVRLSWLSKLRNSYRIIGSEASLEFGIYDWRSLSLTTRAGRSHRISAAGSVRTYAELAAPLLANFLDAARGTGTPFVSAHDVLPSIDLLEQCYSQRTRLAMPWHDTLDRMLVRQ